MSWHNFKGHITSNPIPFLYQSSSHLRGHRLHRLKHLHDNIFIYYRTTFEIIKTTYTAVDKIRLVTKLFLGLYNLV